MSSSTATPQPTTGTPSIRQHFKSVSSAETQTQTETKKERQQKEKEATIAVLKELLEADSQLYGKSVKAVLAYARNVLNARDELRGNGIPELHFDPWTDFKMQCKGGKASVSKCIAIAQHAGINDPKNINCLPASLSTLYELTAMGQDKFAEAQKSVTEKNDTINPAMTRDAARAMADKEPYPGKQSKAAATIASQWEAANNEDHLDAAKALEAEALEAIETSTTFADPLMNDRFFRFDLPALRDRTIDAGIHRTLAKLKSELPVLEGYVWEIALKKSEAAEESAAA